MRIGYLITARLKSSRLKEKIILDIHGKSIIDRVIERCKLVDGIECVVLCTSTNIQDSALKAVALNQNIQYFEGSEDDVLIRLLEAAKLFDLDAFVSITADNPLHDFELASEIIKFYKNESCDFIFCEGLPVGLSPYFIDTKALDVACYMKKESDTEIWGPFVNRPDFFKVGKIKIVNSPIDKSRRLTCDFQEDFQLLSKIFSYFDFNHQPSTKDVFDVLIKYPEILEMNAMHIQRSISPEARAIIIEAFDRNKKIGLDYAKIIEKQLVPGEVIKNYFLK
jgi:spore coat polysaccharide biosynthesis protein SpsF